MSASFQIRRAGPADADAVAHLARQTFTETFGHLYPPEDLAEYLGRCTSASYLDLIGDPTAGVWVAEAPSSLLVGYAVAASCKLPVENLEPHSGELRQLYVLSSHQKARLGAKLFEATLEWFAAQKRNPLYIGVWSENHGAQRFYSRYGFRKVGEYGFPVGQTVDHEFILKR
jgi:ribosomal protein S18 acetylase RimI-like enzyme